SLEEVDVLERVDEAGGVVEVGHRGLAVRAGHRVDHVNGGAGSTEVNAAAACLHVMQRIAAVQGDGMRRAGDGVLDEGTGENDAAVAAANRPGAGQDVDAGRDGVRHADLLEGVECGTVNPSQVSLGEGLVAAAARQSGSNRPGFHGQFAAAKFVARGTAAGSPA